MTAMRHWSRAARIAVLVAVAVLWFVLLRPVSLGGPASYVIVAGDSMVPALQSGDLVVAARAPELQVGDIVVFRVPNGEPGEGVAIIHRIIDGSPATGFVLQGDNTDGPDMWRPTGDEILGRVWFSVPGVGRVVAFVRSPLGLATMGGFAAFAAALYVLPGGVRRSGPHGEIA